MRKNQNPRIRIVTMDELQRLSTRLQKVTNFNFTGAILLMIAGIYFAQAGSQVLPKIFLGMLIFTLILTILSSRASQKLTRVIELLQRKKPKI